MTLEGIVDVGAWLRKNFTTLSLQSSFCDHYEVSGVITSSAGGAMALGPIAQDGLMATKAHKGLASLSKKENYIFCNIVYIFIHQSNLY